MLIHDSAIIEGNVVLGENVRIGPFCYLSGDIKLGNNCVLHERVSIKGITKIGCNNEIHPGAVIGGQPQDKSYIGEPVRLVVGDDNCFRENVTINASPGGENVATLVGSGCFFLSNSHVGHNCVVGNNVLLVNDVNLGGYVQVGDGAYLGGVASVHQFVRVGEYATVSGYSKTIQDAPPYMMVVGQPTRVVGINSVGLDRAGFSSEDKAVLKKAYKLLFRSKLAYPSALERIEAELPQTAHIQRLVEFIRSTKRGVCRGVNQGAH